LGELTEAINWLNRKRQEEVTLEVVAKVRNGVSEIQHIVDFTERVRLNGQEYFLVANQVELTPRSLRQKLKLVRWYE
jgi:predicted SprT family Zn-dependent metalloprotease